MLDDILVILELGVSQQTFPEFLTEMPGVEIADMSIQVDHIHAIMIIAPKYSVSEIIDRLKNRNASMLRKKFA